MHQGLDELFLAAQDVLLLSRSAALCVREGGDLKATLARLRDAYDALRTATRRLGGQDIAPTGQNLAGLLSLRLAMIEARQHAALVRRWLERHEEPDFVADALLGVCWSRRRDPIVLVDDDPTALVAQLRARGQERIVACSKTLPAIDGAFVVPSPFEVRSAVLQYVDPPAQFVSLRRTKTSDPEVALEAERMIQEALNGQRMCANTIDVFGETWVKQGLENLPIIGENPTIDLLRDAFEGIPAVIIASGPSLSKNIDQLHQLKGRTLLITFSHSLGACRRAGLVPDLVMALDPEDLRYHYDGCDVGQYEAALLGATVHPDVLRLPHRRIFTFAANNTLDHWIYHGMGNHPWVATGGSVATSALALSIIWRCSPVIFVGQDLSYPGGKVYADGIADAGTTVVKEGDAYVTTGWSAGYSSMATIGGAAQSGPTAMQEIDDWHGTGKVLTSFSFDMYRRWMEAAIRQNKPLAWNCTEGGARIEGCEHIPLSEAIARLAGRPRVDIGARLDVPFDAAAGRMRMRRRIETIRADLRQASVLARICLGLFGKVVGHPAATKGDRRALRRASRKIQVLADQMPHIMIAHQARLRAKDRDLGPAEWNDGAYENYQLVLRATADMLPIVERHLEHEDSARAA